MDYTKTVVNDTAAKIEPLYQRAQEVVEDVKERLEPVDSWIREMARERPLLTLAGAAGIGYLVLAASFAASKRGS